MLPRDGLAWPTLQSPALNKGLLCTTVFGTCPSRVAAPFSGFPTGGTTLAASYCRPPTEADGRSPRGRSWRCPQQGCKFRLRVHPSARQVPGQGHYAMCSVNRESHAVPVTIDSRLRLSPTTQRLVIPRRWPVSLLGCPRPTWRGHADPEGPATGSRRGNDMPLRQGKCLDPDPCLFRLL